MFKLLALALLISFSTPAFAKVQRPKLIVLFMIDQFRADYLTRFERQFLPPMKKNGDVGGFRYLMQNGAYYPYASYDTLQSITVVGHATVLTGSFPADSGISMTRWYDPEKKRNVECVEDENQPLVGAPTLKSSLGRSPQFLNATTVGDEIKNAGLPSKIVSIALKDRAAILMGGHEADLALWFDKESLRWVSSRHYLPEGELPNWVKKLNSGLTSGDMPKELKDPANPLGVKITLDAALAAINEERLGQQNRVDLLAVSFSTHDKMGHQKGPNSPEIEKLTLDEDQAISQLLNHLKKKIPGGLSQVLFAFSGDHGVSPSPSWSKAHHGLGGFLFLKHLPPQLNEALNKKWGKKDGQEWVTSLDDLNIYLNQALIQDKGLNPTQVENELKRLLQKEPGIAQVITATDIRTKNISSEMMLRQTLNYYVPGRNGDLMLVPKAGWVQGDERSNPGATDHNTGYGFDRTVPLILSGFHIQKGIYSQTAHMVDLAPTLSFLTSVIPPSHSEGRVLSESIITKGLITP